MKGNRFKRQERFAGLVHWLNLLFKAPRRGNRAKLAGRIYRNSQAGDRYAIHARYESGALIVVANTDGVALPSNTCVADGYIVTARDEILAGASAQGYVEETGGAVVGRKRTD